MNITGKHKMYMSVLGLCGAAFAADRLFLAPSEATANDHSAGLQVASAGEVASTAGAISGDTAPAHSRRLIAERLDAIAVAESLDLSNVADAFQPGAAWQPDEEPEIVKVVVEHQGPSAAEVFMTKHSLTAVMALADGGYAIIDGSMLHVGKTLDGFKLVEIRSRSAILESGKSKAVLRMSGASH